MKKRVMIIGPNDSQNSKIVSLLEHRKTPVHIGNIIYFDNTIQVPSSYMRSPSMTKHLISTQQGASCILMVLDSGCVYNSRVYSPNIAKAFRIPRIGVIFVEKSHSSPVYLAHPSGELIDAGVDNIYILNIENSKSCEDFIKKIELVKKGASL